MQGNNYYAFDINYRKETPFSKNPRLNLHYLDNPFKKRLYVVDKDFIHCLLTCTPVKWVNLNSHPIPNSDLCFIHMRSVAQRWYSCRCYCPVSPSKYDRTPKNYYLNNLICIVIKEIIILRRTVIVKVGEMFNLPDEVQREIELYLVTQIEYYGLNKNNHY